MSQKSPNQNTVTIEYNKRGVLDAPPIKQNRVDTREFPGLLEQKPDKEYILTKVESIELEYLNFLRSEFAGNKIPISQYDIRVISYKFKGIGTNGKEFSPGMFIVTNWLRRLWRASLIRRFVKGQSAQSKLNVFREGHGKWTGVHYLL